MDPLHHWIRESLRRLSGPPDFHESVRTTSCSQQEVADCFYPDAHRVPGQVGKWYFIDFNDPDTVSGCAGGHRLVCRLLLCCRQDRFPLARWYREDSVNFATHLSDSGPDGVRNSEVLWAMNNAGTVQLCRH